MIWFKDLPKLTSYYLGDGSFVYSSSFVPSNLNSLQSIEIGNECHMKTRNFTVDGLNALKSLFIGEYSFAKDKEIWDSEYSRAFALRNCAALETIEILFYSFADYAGAFEIKNLPALRSIRLGSSGKGSNNFHYQSFILRGIRRSSLLFDRFPQLWSASNGFQWVRRVSSYCNDRYALWFLNELDLPKLKSIDLGLSALSGQRDKYDCTLEMRSLDCVVDWMQ